MTDRGLRVAVGLSGGVDSALAAYLLQKEGHEVVGLTMSTWDGSIAMPAVEGREGCFGPGEEKSIAEAKSVADRLGIPHHVVPVSDAYRRQVLDYFRAEYRAGRTPNPCVRCNQAIKFGALHMAARRMGIEFDRFATGHYARLDFRSPELPFLYRALDDGKDQTYFLSRLSDEQLCNVLFPLGGMRKSEVKALAAEIGWTDFANKRESQDFLECGDYSVLFEESDRRPGDFVDLSGRVLGQHRGVVNYTVGQRKGLNVGGQKEPLYVVAIDAAANRVVLGPREALSCVEVPGVDLNLMVSRNSPLLDGPLDAHIRLGHRGARARIVDLGGKTIRVRFDEPQYAAAPGQTLVLYADGGVVASAVIDK